MTYRGKSGWVLNAVLALALITVTGCASTNTMVKAPVAKSPGRAPETAKAPPKSEPAEVAKEAEPKVTEPAKAEVTEPQPTGQEVPAAEPAAPAASEEYSEERIKTLVSDIEALVERIKASSAGETTPAEPQAK